MMRTLFTAVALSFLFVACQPAESPVKADTKPAVQKEEGACCDHDHGAADAPAAMAVTPATKEAGDACCADKAVTEKTGSGACCASEAAAKPAAGTECCATKSETTCVEECGAGCDDKAKKAASEPAAKPKVD